MTQPVHLADDCALLPGRSGVVIYLAASNQVIQVQPHVGRWLLQGFPPSDPGISDAERRVLLERGVLLPGPVRKGVSINALAPTGVAGWATLSVLVSTGALTWTRILPEARLLMEMVRDGLHWWPTWVLLPLTVVFFTLLHEWGHVLALRAIGGRVGGLQIRIGWPWAVTVVGPFEAVLVPWQQALLVAGGLLVELTVLGCLLVALTRYGYHPVLGAAVITEVVFVAFNVFPTPWSDGGRLAAIATSTVLSLMERRAGHD